MKIHTIGRDKKTYNAFAEFDGNQVIVQKGSIVNLNHGSGFKASKEIQVILDDPSNFGENGELLKNVTFSSLSSAASFVTGRIANGMIVWKTEDNRYIRYSLKTEG